MRVSRKTNGGIFVRSTFDEKSIDKLPDGYETRVFGLENANSKTGAGLIKRYAKGSKAPAQFDVHTPGMLPGGWFTLEFLAVGNELRSFIDGKEVCWGIVETPPFFERGHIAVQFRGPQNGAPSDAVEFRSIEVRELP